MTFFSCALRRSCRKNVPIFKESWRTAGRIASCTYSRAFTARIILDYQEEQRAYTLLEGLSFFKARHKIESRYQLWQEGSHPQVVQDDEMMVQKLEYMHMNPKKREYIDDPVPWRYSSARNYARMEGLVAVKTDWMQL